MGMTLYFVNFFGAFILGAWWWILEPIVFIALTLTSLTLMSFGLFEIANPRSRRKV
jgi:peptide/nickel transport system permease protein